MAGKSLFISYKITSGEHLLKLNCLKHILSSFILILAFCILLAYT